MTVAVNTPYTVPIASSWRPCRSRSWSWWRRGHRGRPHPPSGPSGHRAERLRRAAGRAVPGVPGARRHPVRAHGRARSSCPSCCCSRWPRPGSARNDAGPAALDLPRRGDRACRLLPVGPARAAGLRPLSRALRARPSTASRCAQTYATGTVSAINFDYRGFDTVGEEFILFAAAAGVSDRAAPPARRAREVRGRRGRRPRCAAHQRRGPDGGSGVHRPAGGHGLVADLARADQPVRRFPGRGHAGHRVHPGLPGRGVPGLQAVQPGRPDRRRRGGRGRRLRRDRPRRGR